MRKLWVTFGVMLVALALGVTPASAAYKVGDIACEASTDTGTGALDLDGAEAPYLDFATVGIGNGDTFPYHLRVGSTLVETGVATYTAGTPNSIARSVEWSTDGAATAVDVQAPAVICIGFTTAHFQNGVAALDIESLDVDASIVAGVNITATAGDLTSGDDVIVGDDILIGSAGVINWDAGDVTLTHAANALTFDGGDLFLADGNGMVFGASAQLTTFAFIGTPEWQMIGTGEADTAAGIARFNAGAEPGRIFFAKSRGATVGAYDVVTNGTYIGCFMWQAADGTNFDRTAELCVRSDGTSGNDDVPGLFEFATTADGASTPTVWWKIRATGTFEPAADNTSDIGSSSFGVDQLFVDNVEIGTATDATITRLSAGNIGVEGTMVKKVGTETIWVPANAIMPVTDTYGQCAYSNPAAVSSTDNTLPSCLYNDGAYDVGSFFIRMPKNWNEGNITYQVYWGAATTSGQVEWVMNCRSFAENDAFTTFSASVAVDDTSMGTANRLAISSASSALTCDGSPAAGEVLLFRFYRNYPAAWDTMAADARLWGILITYTSDAANDD